VQFTDIKDCLNVLKGKESSATVATITFTGSRHPKHSQVSRQSLRTLQLEWMYDDVNFLWLTDEVAI